MRISDWSSDVCSSDLEGREAIEIIAPDLRIVADEPERIPVGGLDQPFRPDRILVELIDVSTVEEVLAPAVALDRHEGGNVRCNVVGQTSCQICLHRDGVIICLSKIEVAAEVVAGSLRADADDTTGRIAAKECALRPFADFAPHDSSRLSLAPTQAQHLNDIPHIWNPR